MTVNPFTTYNSNQRVIAIPPTPTGVQNLAATGIGVQNFGVLTLSAANLAAGVVNAYLYFLTLTSDITAAASGGTIQFQFQFQNAVHAGLGVALAPITASAGNGGAAACTIYDMPTFQPTYAAHWQLSIPGTAVELAFQMNMVGIQGLGVLRSLAGWGIDVLNTGVPGDIGGGGMTAQSATNPNTF